jgi:hypothetical protein
MDKENVVWLTQWRLVYTDCRRQKNSRQGAKPDLSGCIFDGVAVKSAFALLSTKVTKPDCAVFGANMTDKRKGKIAYGENDKCNDRKRFCEP